MNWLRWSGLFLAVLLVLMSFAHALLGLPELQKSLSQAGAGSGSELWIDATAGWLFGSMSMMAFGIIFGSVAMRQSSERLNLVPSAAIGLGFLTFGIGALMFLKRTPHFAMFSVLGLLFLIWALAAHLKKGIGTSQ